MVDAWRNFAPAIVLPTHMGKRGHPILLSATLSPDILALTGDATLATIVRSRAEATRAVDVDDPAVLEDIDTPDDYGRALKRWTAENAT